MRKCTVAFLIVTVALAAGCSTTSQTPIPEIKSDGYYQILAESYCKAQVEAGDADPADFGDCVARSSRSLREYDVREREAAITRQNQQ